MAKNVEEKKTRNRLNKEETRVRAIKALQFRMANYKYEDIATQLGYSNAAAAKKAVDRLLNSQENEIKEQYRLLDAQRLEEIASVWWQKAIYGTRGFDSHKEQLEAAKVILQAMKQRAELLGLEVNTAAQAKLMVEGRFSVTWDTPKRLPEDQLQKLLENQKQNPLLPSSISSEDNGKPPTQ